MKKKLENLFEGFQAGDLWIVEYEGCPLEAYPVLGYDPARHPVCWLGNVFGKKFRPSAKLLATGKFFQGKNYKGWRPNKKENK